MKRRAFLSIPLLAFSALGLADDDGIDPCAGDSALLILLDRPTAADSACVVKEGETLIEAGFQTLSMQNGSHSQHYPDANLRFGLSYKNELSVLLPTYNHQKQSEPSGFTGTSVGLKHEFGYTDWWLGGAELIMSTPSGSNDFGAADYGLAANILNHFNLPQGLMLTANLGASTQTETRVLGGAHYSSINPDIVFSVQPVDALQIYAEVYAQTHTAKHEGFGMNTDIGIQYLFTPQFEVDVAYGQHLSGNLNGFNHYTSVGLGVLF